MMNVELLEKNFGVQFPEELDGTLDLQNGTANCCKFNRWGTLVAVGSTDGRIYIFDFVTKGIVKSWPAHALSICGLSWSRDGRLLATCSADTTVIVWDVMRAMAVQKIKCSSMLVSALFNPRNADQLVVLQLGFPPTVEELRPNRVQRTITNDLPGTAEDGVTAIGFDRRGKYIITGTSKGKIIVYDAKTLKMVAFCRQNSVQPIKNIVVPRNGNLVLTNSADRIIRCFDLGELVSARGGDTLEPMQKLLDIVNKAAWKAVCVSQDGDYICGASTKAHSLYVWERNSGSLIKILHGTKGESLFDVQWHPTRPVILSVANGIVSVWTQAHVENWSAFAPEFTELEENTKYIEKEGEFDLEDEDSQQNDGKDDDDLDNEEIDVVNLRAGEILCSSDEEDTGQLPDPLGANGPLWYLPIAPEVEDPEMRERPAYAVELQRSAASAAGLVDEVESRKRAAMAAKGQPAAKNRKHSK